MTTYDLTKVVPANILTGDILNCPYSGSVKSVTLPKGTYKLEVWGAQGGSYSSTYYGGKGGYSVGTLKLTSSKKLYLYAGGAGKYLTSGTALTAGGFNGGGYCYSGSSSYQGCQVTGGGGSDIRIGSDSLYARVIVAGGGGGSNYYNSTYANNTTNDGTKAGIGGYGGGTSGQGRKYSTSTAYFSGGGSQTAGGDGYSTYDGSFGAGNTTATTRSAGGGGGWYGGSSGRRVGGGGGSGYVYNSSNASNYPSGCLLNSTYYLTSASVKAGNVSFKSPTGSSETGHSGDGYCRITVVQAGYTATWVADGTTVRQDTLSPGDRLSPPNVDKTGYTTSWQVDGVTIDPSTYMMPAHDITITAVYTAKTIHITYYDSGVLSYATGKYGGAIDLPTGSNGTGRFVGWWDGSNTYASTYTAYADTTLIARYDLVGAKLTLDSVSLQPNPVDASATVLLAVTAVVTESPVPRWSGKAEFTTSDGLPMSSPFQVGIWDTSEGDPMAVFAGKGIKSSGRDVPPLQAQTVPLPRCGVWSSGISDANGNISFTITGTVTGGPYTSTIVILTESTVNVTRATIRYDGGTAIAGQCMGSKVEFPKGTYSTFTITITGLSMPYEHVHILNIAPGGSE